jgi:hypothetical protein
MCYTDMDYLRNLLQEQRSDFPVSCDLLLFGCDKPLS